MNVLLFFTVLAILQAKSHPPGASPSVLPQANASMGTPEAAVPPAFEPQLGERHQLSYDNWVALLAREASAVASKHAANQTILLGDSITLWFPPELLPGRRTWLNQGISGETTQGLRKRLSLIDHNQPEVIFIMVGINDLLGGTPDNTLLANYQEILRYLHHVHPQSQIVVQSILPHGAESATWEGRDRLVVIPNQRIQRLNGSLKAIANQNGASYLDLYSLFVDGEGKLRSDLTTDGLHLNRSGYMVWRTAIALYSQTE